MVFIKDKIVLVFLLFFFIFGFFSIAVAGNFHNAKKKGSNLTQFRASISFGPRVINSQVIKNERWDSVLNFSIGAVASCKIHNCQYGIDVGTSTAWNARFNSVNNPNNITVAPLHIYNSAQLNFFAFLGWRFTKFVVEIGIGPNISWIKWLNSIQQAQSGVRVSPILFVKIMKPLSNHVALFIAATQTINLYRQLKCKNSKFNCFNDAGYVSWSSLLLGLTYYLR